MVACVTAGCNSILDKIIQTILPLDLVNFLNIVIIGHRYMWINLWSIVHLIAGILFFFIWYKYSKNLWKGFIFWLIINLAFELTEFILGLKGLYSELFLEEISDIIWDIIFDVIGYCLIWIYYKYKVK